MNTKTYQTLELNKILAKLATYAAFSASQALLEDLEPTTHLDEALRRQQETTEARDLLEERSNLSIGGARDVRPHTEGARRGVLLNATQLNEIKATLQSSALMRRTILQLQDRFPLLADYAYNLQDGKRIVDAITLVINDQGEILDSASPALARIRSDLRVAHDRLHQKLQAIVNSNANAPFLQEAIITMRNGRYVIPIKADARGAIKGIVHDQSSSGATLFIEPMATVEINNNIRELELAEDEEIRRILMALTEMVGGESEAIVLTVNMLAALDAAFAKAKYAGALRASPPQLVGFDPNNVPGSTIKLYAARHPLLDPHKVVPIDVDLDDETYVLVITGPNTGGKTVALKTVGLLAMMAQCGLHIPATEDSTLTVFESIYADIGDEQSIEQSLSTFSSHLKNIIQILKTADDKSLILLDELGAGTDPTEGAAIARALLNEFLQRGVTTFATTHYPELKLYAHSTPAVRNASVEFDVETLSPTYRLIIGLPGRSNALAIAKRLGLNNAIIDEARSYVGESDLTADNLLDEIHRARDEIRQTQSRVVKTESEARSLRDQLQTRLDRIEEERAQILEQAREEAENELETLRNEIQRLKRRMGSMAARTSDEPSPSQVVRELETEARVLNEMMREPVKRRPKKAPRVKPAQEEEILRRGLRIGDRVFVPNLNAEGEIVSMQSGDNVEVQVGPLRVRADADTLEWRSGKKKVKDEETHPAAAISAPSVDSPGMELHLRGFMVEDAIPAVDEYIDQAYLAGLPWVNIVHGRGTGALRKAIRDHLRNHPLVKEYSKAPENQGGDGVTVVKLAAH